MNTTLLLEQHEMARMLERLASQIMERHAKCDHVMLVGIERRGADLARRLSALLEDRLGHPVLLGTLALGGITFRVLQRAARREVNSWVCSAMASLARLSPANFSVSIGENVMAGLPSRSAASRSALLCADRYCACTGIRVVSAAASALTVSIPREGVQSSRMKS